MVSRTISIALEHESRLKEELLASGFMPAEAPHAFWQMKSRDCVVTFYKSGKVVVQGRDAEEFSRALLAYTMHDLEEFPASRWIGVDESGKGDYFGPLVAAAVLVEPRTALILREIGVMDSKEIPDKSIKALAPRIRATVPNSIVSIGPEKYNLLYAKFRNLNKLLAWSHARAIENILDKEQAELVIVDKFGDEAFLRQALMEKGRAISVEQKTRAERDVAVAAASILARSEFLKRLETLGEEAGFPLPKGASSSAVVETARKILSAGGEKLLEKVAKIHFKVTDRALNSETAIFPDLK